MATESSKESILSSLRGQVVRIPELDHIFSRWPRSRNQHYHALRPLVDRRLEALIKDGRKLAKLRQADFALFASSWWPAAGFDELTIVAYLAIWLFLWDDELDEPTGSLTDDFEGSQSYRAKTTKFVQQSLGLADHDLKVEDLHLFISSFEPIGTALRNSYTVPQRQMFLDEMVIFMEASEAEQRVKLKDEVWTLPEYWQCRLGTSAVGVCSAVIEYTRSTRVPEELNQHSAMKTVWYETNMIVSIVNDLLSLKKELHVGSIDSLIPLAYASGVPLQTAVDEAVVELQKCVERFDAAARLLTEHVEQKVINPDSSTDSRPNTTALAGFLETSRQNCTGNLEWSLCSPRYGLGNCVRNNGFIHVEL